MNWEGYTDLAVRCSSQPIVNWMNTVKSVSSWLFCFWQQIIGIVQYPITTFSAAFIRKYLKLKENNQVYLL